ncbi:MAG: cysteine hydrolase [Rhodospirillaceae bacterium]|jgi:ureidoacrylate peracid hydrolase|nr:cysteine hydrolase [Rhodospirillaceae bacterium]MBT5566968.1 cysteine hydrolase [Rhodospirillaceae bacterium]MBT6090345.1 cysteine hydrolase [Rhodospirillaceae bacterium]MBT7450516.1 cysteine hydrolase [Rhodospirillaceae bacterium]
MAAMELARDKTALIVVDMQNSFCADDGGCGKTGLPIKNLQAAIKPCVKVVAAARAAGIPVIYTRYMYRPDYADGGVLIKHLLPEIKETQALQAGTWDIEVIPELKPHANDFIVDKNRPSSFYATNLETILNGLDVDSLVVCGVTTNCCVESTVRDASHRDYKTFVVQDAVAELDDERNEVALKSMAMLFANLVSVADVEGTWSLAQAAE